VRSRLVCEGRVGFEEGYFRRILERKENGLSSLELLIRSLAHEEPEDCDDEVDEEHEIKLHLHDLPHDDVEG